MEIALFIMVDEINRPFVIIIKQLESVEDSRHIIEGHSISDAI